MNGLFLWFVAWNARRPRMQSMNLMKEAITSKISSNLVIITELDFTLHFSYFVIKDSRICDTLLISKCHCSKRKTDKTKLQNICEAIQLHFHTAILLFLLASLHLRSEHVNPLGRRSIIHSFEFIILFVSLSVLSACYFASFYYWLPIEWTSRLGSTQFDLLLFTYVAEERKNERKKKTLCKRCNCEALEAMTLYESQTFGRHFYFQVPITSSAEK